MTDLERKKLMMLREEYPYVLTADEALKRALHAEQIKRGCSPGYHSWQLFAYDQQVMETMALLLEKEAAANT